MNKFDNKIYKFANEIVKKKSEKLLINKIKKDVNKMKSKEKKNFDVKNVDAKELQKLCKYLNNNGYWTHVSSGGLAVQRS